jgi:glycosyltransferase involved in cell wall biosynthesis
MRPVSPAVEPAVLMVAPFLSGRDGRWSYAEDLSLRLRSAGFPVRTSSPFYFRPLRLADMVGSAMGWRGAFEAAIVDVYSGRALFWAEAVAKALRARKKPFALALRGGALPDHAQREPARVRALLEAADAVVAPSPFLQEAFEHWRPGIRLIPNAIDLAEYPRRAGGPCGPKLMWLRSFHSMYHPEMAIQVLARVLEHDPGAELTMTGMDRGDGSLQRCRHLAGELGVAGRVRFTGVVPKREVGQLLSQGHVFLNTTNVDNTPVSVLEAMACGLCVVSTDAGGVPHLVRDGEDALLVQTGDTAAMAAKVIQLLRDPDLGSRLSAAAAARAAEFGWDRVLPRWSGLLMELTRREARRTAC